MIIFLSENRSIILLFSLVRKFEFWQLLAALIQQEMNIGIKHDLTSAGHRGSCWNPSLKGEGINTPRGAQQILMYQKSMFDRYYA